MVTESIRNWRKQSSDDGNSAVWLLVDMVTASVAMVALVESVSPSERSNSWVDFLATDIPDIEND